MSDPSIDKTFVQPFPQSTFIMAPGRPRKKARNTSGLRNQQLDRLSPLPGSPLANIESDGTAPRSTPSRSRSRAPSPDEDQDFPDWHDLANSEVGSKIDQDESGGEEDFWEDLDDEEFGERLIKMAMEDDPKDVDWIPLKKAGKAKVPRGKSSLQIQLEQLVV